jgi:hypothetical protein
LEGKEKEKLKRRYGETGERRRRNHKKKMATRRKRRIFVLLTFRRCL